MASTDSTPRENGGRPNWAEKLTAIATVGGVLIAFIAVSYADVQIRDAVQARRAQNYLELRKLWFDIDKNLDKVDREKEVPANEGCEGWNYLKRYWYFSQTEWMVETQVDKEERKTWDENTQPLVVGALSHRAFRKAFVDMGKTRFAKNPEGVKFYCEIARAYDKTHPTPLSKEQFELFKCDNNKLPARELNISPERRLAAKSCECTIAFGPLELPKCDELERGDVGSCNQSGQSGEKSCKKAG